MSSLIRACRAMSAAFLFALVLSASQSASAATFTVNDLGDAPDASTADGLCSTADDVCTLRAAIEQANDLAGDDTIEFSVAGTINLTGGSVSDPATALVISSNIEISGPGANLLTVRRDTGGDYRVFSVLTGTTVKISGLTIADGQAPGGSSESCPPEEPFCGICPPEDPLCFLTALAAARKHPPSGISGSCLPFCGGPGGGGDQGDFGGGILNAGALTLENSTVSGNSAGGGGGSFFGGQGGHGGGIYNSGTLTITNSTIGGNNHAGSGGDGFEGGPGGDGGGIYNSGTLTITNSTVSGNSAGSGGGGLFLGGIGGSAGGIFNSGPLTMTNSTVSNNSAGTGGFGDMIDDGPGGNAGGILNNGGEPANLKSSIVAGNTASDGVEPDVSGTFISQGYNLIGDNTGSNFVPGNPNPLNDIVGDAFSPIDPLLDPLNFYGGPTKTHRLQTGSPAIDKGQTSLDTDQRGADRPYDYTSVPDAADGDTSDIGAYELQLPANMEITKKDSTDPLPVGASFTYELRVYNRGPNIAHNVTVVDVVPSGLTLTGVSLHESSDFTGAGCAAISNTVSCSFGTMRVFDNTFDGAVKKGKALIIITVTASQVGQYTNEAVVAADETDPDMSDNTGRQTTTVLGISSVTVTPDTVPGGSDCQKPVVRVTLTGITPYDIFLPLSDDLAATTNLPGSSSPFLLRIPEGQSSATLLVDTSQVLATETGQVTASFGGSSASAPLTVKPIGVRWITVSPTSVTGGQQSTATVNLDCAPSSPVTVVLKSSKGYAAKFINPATSTAANSITVQMTTKQATFTIETYGVSAPTGVNISAQGEDGVQRNTRLDVLPAGEN